MTVQAPGLIEQPMPGIMDPSHDQPTRCYIASRSPNESYDHALSSYMSSIRSRIYVFC